MSSAALQAAPHQPSTVTLSPASSPSSLQYASQPIPPREPYYNQQPSNASPPSTARRPTRRPSGNGASPISAQQPHVYSPIGGGPASAPVTSRPSNSAIQTTTSNTSTYSNTSPIEYQRGIPPVAPPRTSSNQRTSGAGLAAASASDRSRRGAYTTESSSGRMASTGDGQQDRPESDRNNNGIQVNGNEGGKDDNATGNATSRSRRKPQQATSETYLQKSNITRETRSSQSPSTQNRPQAIVNSSVSSPNDLSREGSEILNRVVVSKPEVDIERERARMAEAKPSSDSNVATGLSVGDERLDDATRGPRSRHDHTSSSSKREKHTRFGEYYLGNTLGEGEFGKVRMGWKQGGGVEVAIKLIRRDSVGSNTTRLAKIYREIAILREISHPNIVRLHEMVETEKHIGIILEYASGGELFDYILNHRYLKDHAARRLFAQLVSGVGYLHKKGIVHRDLKLENLLLDRNRNIIITDFGFANTFNPADELGEDIEYGLSNREYVKKMELDKVLPGGYRRGDLMQTSCGSPCYAAPELVVSDCLYTGRKVDVWSCGVILYAMLAGYLPFDDDPANPEGDNISLLYKYIVSTPLTFPEYVTPHARDLLRRILVPDPRKRADLFEVARHSWLSEYAHVVGFITSSTTTTGDIANATVGAEESADAPLLTRSASVREPKMPKAGVTPIGDLSRKTGNIDQEADELYSKSQKDTKRRTLQVEYVEPRSQTVRGEDPPLDASTNSQVRARGEVQDVDGTTPDRKELSTEKPLPQDPPTAALYQNSGHSRGVSGSQRPQGIAPSTRPGREPSRSASDNQFMGPLIGPSIARPNTGGSMNSTGSGRGSMGLPARGSYGQPVAPTVAGTNAHGRMTQPKSGKNHMISGPIPITPQDDHGSEYGHSVGNVPPKSARVTGFSETSRYVEPRGHKRSNTIGGISEKIFGRNVSFFGKSQQSNPDKIQEKPKRSYPPVSMSGGIGGDNPRQSVDSSRRSISFGFGRKRSGSIAGSGGTSSQKESRRFSLFSLRAIGISKDYGPSAAPPPDDQYYDGHGDSTLAYPEPPIATSQGRLASGGSLDNAAVTTNSYDRTLGSSVQQDRRAQSAATPPQRRRHTQVQGFDGQMGNSMSQHEPPSSRLQAAAPSQSDPSLHYKSQTNSQAAGQYTQGFNDYDLEDRRQVGSRGGRGVLQKNNRKFAEAYEEPNYGYGGKSQNSGSSVAARKVMDFFRRRGKAREGDSR